VQIEWVYSLYNRTARSGSNLNLSLWFYLCPARDACLCGSTFGLYNINWLRALCTPYTARLSSGIVSGSERHREAVQPHLVFPVVYPIPAYQMGRIAAGFVSTCPVSDADVIGNIHTASPYPPQPVNPYMLTVECIEPMPAIEERTHP